MTFNGTELTEETIKKTHQHFIDIYKGCIDEVKRGEVRVNDKEKYFSDCQARINEHLNGGGCDNFTFLQRAYWIQTGESVALLP